MTLLGVLTISLNISKIVKAINGAGNQAERCKDDQRGPKQIPLQQVVAEEDWRKHESVFEPLQRAKQSYIVYHRGKNNQFSRNIKITSEEKFISVILPQIVLFKSIVSYFACPSLFFTNIGYQLHILWRNRASAVTVLIETSTRE